ncbi:MAG: valine--tRNA ligase [Eubacteriales bacterium]
MKKELPKVYSPQESEEKIYQKWEESGCFRGVRDESKESFTIVMPPPNVTGQLHMGHAMDCTLQDVLIRFKRMQGYAALWVPGTDHAGIATQIKVEQELRETEGLTKHDLGREKFLEKVWEWKEKYGNRIVEQQKKIGSSCDWERSRFTMDEGCSKAVKKTFIDMYNDGLIYKGSRIINWCPHCVTALSDAEVDYQEKDGHLWHLRYPIAGQENQYVIVATTRPETMFGDTAVAVHPEDERYADLIGKQCVLPLMNRLIPIVADEFVDREFGTGCVKITPAHDPNDFEVGQRHDLEQLRVLDDNGCVNAEGRSYAGMDRLEARKKIIKDLEAMGLVEKIEKHRHNVGTCYRCSTDVEPILSSQWFVKMDAFGKMALGVMEREETKFVPDRFSKIFTNWMENVHDWCISRQLWWGHQIPVYYCEKCHTMVAGEETPKSCPHCSCEHFQQDTDVLDTWFSSALWPFSTLGWPETTEDYDYFYPTDVLVTGYDIIFFWVARMVFSAYYHTGKTPFHTVFIHGLVRDEQGRKMSKTLNNGIDPLEVAKEYGADALRFNLVTGIGPGNDTRFFRDRCEAMGKFANKIWNASRFLMMNLTIEECKLPSMEKLKLEDKWILHKLNELIPQVVDNMEKFELGVAAQNIYDFIWDSYCDWYIELTKTRLLGDGEEEKIVAQQVLCYVLTDMLKLLHPFMPYITEEIWQALPHEGEFLMLSSFPTFKEEFQFPEEAGAMEEIMTAISAVRTRRAEMNVPPSKKAQLVLVTEKGETFALGIPFFLKLASVSEVKILSSQETVDMTGMVTAITPSANLYIPLSELVDLDKEKARIEKEMKKNQEELGKLLKKLENPGFTEKAPAAVVEGERNRCTELENLIKKLEEQLKTM